VHLHILSDGESVFSGEIGQEEIGFPVSFPTGGADLLVKAEAPGTEGRFAVRLSLEEDGDVLAETTFWGNSPLNGVLTIPSREEAR
jgi:hypothetical protein